MIISLTPTLSLAGDWYDKASPPELPARIDH